MPLDELKAISELAHSRDIPLHMDGARIFNAAVALGSTASEIAQYADSVTFCVSKGLAAPVGSVLCGTKEFIARAYRGRKIIGGAMRQAGIVAGGGLFALNTTSSGWRTTMRTRSDWPAGLRRIPGVSIDRDDVQMNMFFIRLGGLGPQREGAVGAPARAGHPLRRGQGRQPGMRLVTHYGIEQADIDRVIDAFAVALGAQPAVAGVAVTS